MATYKILIFFSFEVCKLILLLFVQIHTQRNLNWWKFNSIWEKNWNNEKSRCLFPCRCMRTAFFLQRKTFCVCFANSSLTLALTAATAHDFSREWILRYRTRNSYRTQHETPYHRTISPFVSLALFSLNVLISVSFYSVSGREQKHNSRDIYIGTHTHTHTLSDGGAAEEWGDENEQLSSDSFSIITT